MPEENVRVENTVEYGLKNAYYSKITIGEDGSFSYADPVKMQGSVELSLEPRGDMIEFYADDMLYYSAPNNQGYDGTMTIAKIGNQFAQDCLGEKMDEQDYVLNEIQSAKPSPFALMFEFDGDVKATRHVLYNCTASRPTVASKTNTDTVEPNTNELKFVASPRPSDTYVKTKTTPKTPQAVYDNWYKAVYTKKTSA